MGSGWIDPAANAFSALGTVGAFVVGFVLLQREHHREAERAEDERRAQAAKISAWIEIYTKRDGGRELAFHIHNASDMPIDEVEVPSSVGEPDAGAEFIGFVPPGKTVLRPAVSEWSTSYIQPEPIVFRFIDSAGHSWVRNELGQLSRNLA